MTIEVFHRLLKANEFGKAKKLAIQLKLSDQFITDAIRPKKSENGPPPYQDQKKFWKFQLEHDTFWVRKILSAELKNLRNQKMKKRCDILFKTFVPF